MLHNSWVSHQKSSVTMLGLTFPHKCAVSVFNPPCICVIFIFIACVWFAVGEWATLVLRESPRAPNNFGICLFHGLSSRTALNRGSAIFSLGDRTLQALERVRQVRLLRHDISQSHRCFRISFHNRQHISSSIQARIRLWRNRVEQEEALRTC